ncbi:MAG TPA: PAS domain-containing protein, partial [candidate division Zixibacteria bacterium]|nr:PAS domain-containing protein [candidate division Zixibacteria bacterium]
MEPDTRDNLNPAEGPLPKRVQEYERWIRTLDYQVRTLERERQKLSAIVNHSDAGFLALDSGLRILWANQTFAERFGAQLQRIPAVGAACNQVLCGRGAVCDECPARKLFVAGEAA